MSKGKETAKETKSTLLEVFYEVTPVDFIYIYRSWLNPKKSFRFFSWIEYNNLSQAGWNGV